MYPENVMDKIQEIEKLSESATSLKEGKDKEDILINLKEKIKACCKYVSDINENTEYSISMEVIQLLWMLNNKYKFEELFNSKIDFQIMFYFVKAFYAQNFWKLDNLSKDLTQIENLIFAIFPKNGNLYKLQNKKFPNRTSIFGKDNIHLINYSLILAETLMQHTAVLSQLGNHEKALDKVESCYNFFERIFFSLKEILEHICNLGMENVKIIDFKNEDFFKNCLLYMEFLSSLNLLNLEDSKNGKKFNLSMKDLDSNFIKKFENENKNILKKIDEKWVMDLHISHIVKLNDINQFLEKLENPNFNEKIIMKIVLIFSCCIFSIAAENRFISHVEISKEKKKQLKDKNQPDKILENYSKELKLKNHKRFHISQKIHAKSIESLLFGINKESKLFLHFMQSYKKNYNFNMFMIQEVEEPSISSIKNSEYFTNQFIVNKFQKMPEINNKWQDFVSSTRKKNVDKLNNKIKNLKVFNKKKYSKSPLGSNKRIFKKYTKKLNLKTISINNKNITKNTFTKKNNKNSLSKINTFEIKISKLSEKDLKKKFYSTNETIKKSSSTIRNKKDYSTFNLKKRKKENSIKHNTSKSQERGIKKKNNHYLYKKHSKKRINNKEIPNQIRISKLVNKMQENIKSYVNSNKSNIQRNTNINMKIDNIYVNSIISTNDRINVKEV